MYSMNYLGKVFANFREFYNEINAATLTGAIDVVVVEQPDGSFTCSPFHVRFGKLGVLRSRLKVVDLELNGEPLSIHMKLGESGEAFFVEEIPEDELEASAHLATSPIPDNGFLYPPQQPATLPRRNSADYPLDKYQNQVSDFSHRRYTDGQGTQKSDFSAQKREYQMMKDNNLFDFDQDLASQEQEPMFAMDDLDDHPPEFTCKVDQITTATITTGAAKMFRAEEVNDKDSHAKEVVRKISINNDFRPISMAKDDPTLPPTNEGKQCAEEAVIQNQPEEIPKSQSNGNNKKKKKTKKSGSKKKNAQRKSSSSSNGYSSQSETIVTESVETEKTNERLSAEQMDTEDISPSPAYSMAKMIPDVHFYSDTDVVNESTGRDGTPVQSDSELEMARGSGTGGIGGADGGPPSQSWRWGELPSPLPNTALDTNAQQEQHNLQDKCQMEHPISSGAPGTSSSMLSGMFNFMKPSRGNPQAAETEGMYLAELATGAIDPEVAALYFPPSQGNTSASNATESLTVDINAAIATEEDYESGNGPSLPQSPSSVEGPMCKGIDSDEDDIKIFCKGYVGLSLCGPGCLQQSPAALAEAFEQEAIRFEALCDDPSLVQNPRLVVRLGDQYMPWLAAAPMLISLIVFHRPLPKSVVQNLPGAVDGAREKAGVQGAEGGTGKAQQRQGYSWWYWRRSTDKQSTSDQPKPSVDNVDGNRTNLEQESSTTNIQEKSSVNDLSQDTEKIEDQKSEERESPQEVSTQTSFPLLGGSGIAGGGGYSGSQSSEESDEGGVTTNTTPQTHSKNSDKFRKTLRLSSDQIASLNLREGMNEMLFSVTTAYQGTSRCKCHVFRWRHDDKIVISDIDGTITKSDVLGHIFPLVGKDWAQSGVAQLFTKIKNNGYKILYLSARAIGQAKVTREYLRSIKQGDLSLPDGPLLLNPTSLLRAFHREVIEKKPEEFKIQCLSDIMALFPEGSKPFYAGYGNRINDVCAYETVGIPIVRIFTINSKGELKHELTQTFQSSYSNMSYIVDHLFPPVRGELCEDYSQFVYWREPVAALPPPPTPSQHSTLPSIPEGPSD